MKTGIPEDIALNIQTSVDRKKVELKKAKKEIERKAMTDKKYAAIERKRWQAVRGKTMESAKENLIFLNEIIKQEPLKSYLKLEKTTGFHLRDNNGIHSDATIFLRSDGVYVFGTDDSGEKTYKNAEKITLKSLIKNARNRSGLPDYIWSLEQWNASNFIKYLKEQFTPVLYRE